MKPNLIILRGLPGSGKSTFAELLQVQMGYLHVETDMYFSEIGFDPRLLSEAHKWCQNYVFSVLKHGGNVVVSNTFTQEWEMDPYISYCKDRGLSYTVIIVENRHGNESIHDVPEATMQKMRNRFEVKL